MLRNTRQELQDEVVLDCSEQEYTRDAKSKTRSLASSPDSLVAGILGRETVLKTLWGEKRLSDVRAGEQVLTRDNGYQTVRWAGSLEVPSASQLVVIRVGALGANLPRRDLIVSVSQRILSGSGLLKQLFKTNEALIRAGDLLHLQGVELCQTDVTDFGYQVLLKRHELVLADDVWTESFQPDRVLIKNWPKSQRLALERLCPKLSRGEGRRAFPAARTQMRLRA